MKTTLEIHDELLARAKRHAKDAGLPLRAVVEEGLRCLLSAPEPAAFELADRRVGDPEREDPLERFSWPELRGLIYGGEAS